MKRITLLLFLGFCMLLSGCGGSNTSSNPSTTIMPSPTPSPTQTVSVTLPAKYQIDGVSYDLPSGKSWRIIACGNTAAGVELFQEHIFTQTGSVKSFQLPVYANVAQYIAVNTIALDGSFTDDAGASYVKGRCLMVVKQQSTVSPITFSETDPFMIIGTSTSLTKMSDLLNLYQIKFSRKFNLTIK